MTRCPYRLRRRPLVVLLALKVFAILVTERFADPIVSLPPDVFRKREPVHLRSAITGKIGSPVTIRQTQVTFS
jgi:hypothetical protein